MNARCNFTPLPLNGPHCVHKTFLVQKLRFPKALKLSIQVILSFCRRNLTLKLAWISSLSCNILASIDQVFLINFQFQVSKIKFRYQNRQLKYFRITRAQFLKFSISVWMTCVLKFPMIWGLIVIRMSMLISILVFNVVVAGTLQKLNKV